MPYSQASVSINSATVPVSIMPPGDKTAWTIRVRSEATTNILLFAYSGALPGSAPTGLLELAPGQAFTDADQRGSYLTDSMQQGWAAVLLTTGPVTVDAVWRS
jgi:hypothetical protein